jgi:hypothetical protein
MGSWFMARGYSDSQVIGVDNGVQQVEMTCLTPGVTTRALSTKLGGRAQAPDIDLASLTLKATPLQKARLTDFLSYGPSLARCPFMVSEAAQRLLSQFNLGTHAFMPCDVSLVSGRLPYALFWSEPLPWDAIDFARSTFYEGSPVTGKRYLSLASHAQWEAQRQARLIWAETVALSDAFDDSLDWFGPRLGGDFVSERLARACMEAGLTGLKFIEASPADGELHRGRRLRL